MLLNAFKLNCIIYRTFPTYVNHSAKNVLVRFPAQQKHSSVFKTALKTAYRLDKYTSILYKRLFGRYFYL